MLTAFKHIFRTCLKLFIFTLLLQTIMSYKNTDTKTFLTEKSNLQSHTIETFQEMALSNLQLTTRLQLKAKMKTISSFFKEYSEIIFSNEHLNAIKHNSNLNSKTGQPTSDEIYAYYNKNNHHIEFFERELKNKSCKNLVARGIYDRTRFHTGWDKLSITTYPEVNPLIQCYTAGLIEGVLSFKEIYSYYHNIHVFFYKEENYIQDIKNFYLKIDTNIKNKINEIHSNNFSSDEDILHWSYITCLNAQINGLYTGYNMMAEKEKALDLYDFYFINSEGNFGDLKIFMEISKMKFDSNESEKFYSEDNLKKFYNTANIDEIWKSLMRKGHCSVIAKLVKTDDGEYDILAGHNTWSDYSEMLRTLKTIDMAFEGNSQYLGMRPKRINYSSYPGVLFSGDDFYQLDSNIVILQTTLSVINKYVYQDSIEIDKYIPEFMRLMIINYTSDSGTQWMQNYKQYKNHMYITQWIIIDYNVLDRINRDEKNNSNGKKSNIPGNSNLNYKGEKSMGENYENSGLILLLEEVPRSILSEDVSKKFLDDTYFGSFNIAYFEHHMDMIGLSYFKQIDLSSKEYNPRNYILKKLHGVLHNLKDLEALIQYNGYQTEQDSFPDDPSYNDANSGISARGDYGRNQDYHGGIDFKVVNKEFMNKMNFSVYGGPTYLFNSNFTPFDFSKVTDHRVNFREGIPTVWNFKPFVYAKSEKKRRR